MALSNNLISQFAKLTNEKNKDTGTSVKATFKVVDGKNYVLIDGSDILTPVNMNVEAVLDERVVVLIKDHIATVTENITSPAARNASVKEISISQDSISSVLNNVDKKTEENEVNLNAYKLEVSSKFTQASDQYNFIFTSQILPLIQNGDSISQETLAIINQYIQFIAGNIILGASNSQFSIKISNEKISFIQGLDNEIAYFSNNTLYISNAIVGKKLIIGDETTPTKWQWDIDDSGNLNLGKAGGY